MDYFRILNLNREPFSNSPEPDFFFQSAQHLGCLQKIELAIRLRRGLNVVIGDVGTGKTTLCRELIRRLAPSEENKNIETHLFLDPSFTSPAEFLASVAGIFCLEEPDKGLSEWQLKEGIKNYLFKKGVDEGKTIVLIIDEGQKLPEFGREILREFLNYETNEYKLLQIIIFAQTEFEEVLRTHVNFADRINLKYTLGPLSFRDTVRMIKFRIQTASAPDQPPALFTYSGFFAVYRYSRGYPRKIITLCHHVMLTLIIQNQHRAHWAMVRSCALRTLPEPPPSPQRIRWASVMSLITLFAAVFLLGFLFMNHWSPSSALRSDTSKPIDTQPQVTGPPVTQAQPPQSNPQDTSSPSQRSMPPRSQKAPATLGNLDLRTGQVMWGRIVDIYGVFDREVFNAVIRANPKIQNPNRLRTGEVIHFPALASPLNPLSPDKHWVQLFAKESLEEANGLIYLYPPNLPALRIFPYWNSQEGLVFSILLKQGFATEADALASIRQLPPAIGTGAKIVKGWKPDTVFYARR